MCSLAENVDVQIYNRDVKKYLIDHYKDGIQFAPNPRKNESEIVFSAHITAAEMAAKVTNLNVLKLAGETLRQAMQAG